MEEKNYISIASQVYESINLLTIRRTVNMICDLSEDEIEEFVQQYSAIVIFLLNILDQKLSSQLINKLTDASILYIIAEEFRTILIRQMARVSGELDELVDLSNYLEVSERKEISGDITDSAATVLQLLWDSRKVEGKDQFNYLASISDERRKKLYLLLKEENIHIAMGLMIYSPDSMLFDVMDDLVLIRPEILQFLPYELIDSRIKKKYELYLQENVFHHLPEKIKDKINDIHELIFERFRSEFQKIKEIKKSEDKETVKKQKILNIVYGMLEGVRPGMRDTMLGELSARNIITEDDISMLITVKEMI